MCSCIGDVSNTDLVNSGSYFTELFVVVRGITTFPGLGGSFLITGFTVCFIDTNDLGSLAEGFFTGMGFSAGLATDTGFATGLATGLALAAGLWAAALATGFLATTFFAAGLTVFFAGLCFFTIFLVDCYFKVLELAVFGGRKPS